MKISQENLLADVQNLSLDTYFFGGRQILGFPGGADGKESAYNAEDLDSVPELGRSPGEENGNPP